MPDSQYQRCFKAWRAAFQGQEHVQVRTARVNTLVQGDSIERLKTINPGSIDLVFADPPFNIGYD